MKTIQNAISESLKVLKKDNPAFTPLKGLHDSFTIDEFHEYINSSNKWELSKSFDGNEVIAYTFECKGANIAIQHTVGAPDIIAHLVEELVVFYLDSPFNAENY